MTNKRLAAALLAAVLASTLGLTNCAGPGYYVQATTGHLHLMRQREPVNELLERDTTDAELADDLALAAEIRQFAIDALGLPDNDSYTTYARTGRTAAVWNVVAAPEFSLEPKKWCFVVSGCVPYRGYFDDGKAQVFADKLARKSLDVTVSPAIAYSTLGWFSDPLLDTMFQYSDVQLAAYIFHELAHQKLYVKGDTDFNESYAAFVERVGVERWLPQTRRNDQLAGWRSMKTATRQLNTLLQETREALREEYQSGRPPDQMRRNKQAILERMKTRYARLVDQDWNGRDHFGAWIAGDLNNASLALWNSYQGGECAFAALYERADGDMRQFHKLAEAKAKAGADERRRWLEQPC